MADRNTNIRSSQIKNDTIKPEDLDTTNSPSNFQVLSYDSVAVEMKWRWVILGSQYL